MDIDKGSCTTNLYGSPHKYKRTFLIKFPCGEVAFYFFSIFQGEKNELLLMWK